MRHVHIFEVRSSTRLVDSLSWIFLLLLLLGIVVDDEVVRFGVGEEDDDDGEVVEV